jgi:hypothetical protein
LFFGITLRCSGRGRGWRDNRAMAFCYEKAHRCADIASVPGHPSGRWVVRSVSSCNDLLQQRHLGSKAGGCRGTISLPAGVPTVSGSRAVYPCNDSPLFSLRTCRWASHNSGWPMRGAGRRHTPAYRQGTQTVLKARLAKSSLQQHDLGGVMVVQDAGESYG